MAYTSANTLIARPLGLSGFWDVLEKVGKAGINVFQSGEQAKGAAAVLTAQQQAQAAQAAQGGISTGTILMVGAAGLAVVLLLKKKKG